MRRVHAGDVGLAEQDLARARLQELGQQVEDRALARAVRPDQGVDPAVMNVDVDVVHRLEVSYNDR